MARQPDIQDVLPPEKSHKLKKVWNWNEKSHSSKYSYKIGILHKKVKSLIGEAWNDVYSKIKKEFPGFDNYINVELNCFTRDGIVYDSEGKELGLYWRQEQLYVAEDGILKAVKRKINKWQKPANTLIEFNKKKYHRDNTTGIWWEVLKTEDNSWQVHRNSYGWLFGSIDVIHNCRLSPNQSYDIYGKAIVVTKKQQCGKRTCKKLNALIGA